MVGRKFRLSTHQKNEERRKQLKKNESATPTAEIAIPHQIVTDESFTVSIQLTSYIDGHVFSSDALCHRLSSQPLPPLWMIVCAPPLTLCKLRVQQEEQASKADITINISISANLEWMLHFLKQELTPSRCPLLREVPMKLTNVTAVVRMMALLDSAKLCVGNSEEKFFRLWRHRALTLHGSASMEVVLL